MKVSIKNLFSELDLQLEASQDLSITGIQFDSRKVKRGDLFVAVSGHESDGHTYIDHAIANGAVCIIGEKEAPPTIPVPYLKVENSRLLLAQLSNAYYGHPFRRRKVIGITGTNGKTTTAYMLKHILNHNGLSATVLGTVSYLVNGIEHSSSLTTPDALSIQRMIHESTDDVIIMEVSSHGLSQYRVTGPIFDYAIFTNLSHEHLDYHQNMEDYYMAKKRLFKCLKPDGKALVGLYSKWGQRLMAELSEELVPVLPFGSISNSPLQKQHATDNCSGLPYQMQETNLVRAIGPHIPGIHNIRNAIGSYRCALDIGLSNEQVISSLRSFTGAPGRFETFPLDNGAKVIIDYAHTPDGLRHALATAKEHTDSRLFHITGFRGKRDKSKRKIMVDITRQLSDHVFLTLDDLNGVRKEDMCEEMNRLAANHKNISVIEDRTLAIESVITELNRGDVLIITGKGPEKYESPFFHQTSTDKETVMKVCNASSIL